MAPGSHHQNMSASPTKKKSRCCAGGDEGTAASWHKRPKNAPEFDDSAGQGMMVDDTSGCSSRQSGREGAGSGGRVAQLAKIWSLLEEPVKRVCKQTDLPDDAVEDPCTPEKAWKGGRRKKVCTSSSDK
jgi:hypothetical protein